MTGSVPAPLRRRLFLWGPVILLLAYEVYLSSQSDLPGVPISMSYSDKIAHAAYYFLMTTFAYRALRFGHGWRRVSVALVAVAAALVYGLVDEWHQSFVPLRDSDPLDVAADVAGALLAAAVSERIWRPFEG